MEKANILRGKKWQEVKDKAEFEKDNKTLEWLDKQENIVKDLESYKNSIKPIVVKKVK